MKPGVGNIVLLDPVTVSAEHFLFDIDYETGN